MESIKGNDMKATIILGGLLLVACTAAPVSPEFETPECSSERECDVKWRAAEGWIVHRAGRPVVENTGTMMRTQRDQSPGNYLSVSVEKIESAPGRYRLEASIYCAKRIGCDPSPYQALLQFNRAVNNAWKTKDRSGDEASRR